MRRAALLALAALAACGSPKPAAAPEPTPSATSEPSAAASPAAAVPAPSLAPLPAPAQDLAVLDSRDCPTIVQAYVDALARNDFALAARVWNDPVIDGARLKALFTGYRQPAIAFTGSEQEGAAGSSYCTVRGTLTDAANPAKPAQKGEIVLKRVNDVPGATPAQLRWTIRSSTFVEQMQRTG